MLLSLSPAVTKCSLRGWVPNSKSSAPCVGFPIGTYERKKEHYFFWFEGVVNSRHTKRSGARVGEGPGSTLWTRLCRSGGEFQIVKIHSKLQGFRRRWPPPNHIILIFRAVFA